MKKILIICLVLMATVSLKAEDLQKEAASAYIRKNYQTAAQLYEKLLSEQGESAELYYNLGNAYYKADLIPSALLNYERALLLSPGDDDIRRNLEIARLKTVDKITPIDRFLLGEWVRSIQMQAGSNGWAKTSVALFLLFIGALSLYFFAGRVWLKKISFFGGIAVLFMCILSNYFAYEQKKRLTDRDQAIMFSPSVVVKSTPDNSGTDLFVVHQGTKVSLKDKVGDWTRIQLEDGNNGWVKEDTFKQI